ncbi:universal stress protein [Zobellia roscoffensis]|uniref:universal stress protein n=1 Tax=Zobellia roscoffensis TaxID=2779508 RepID=UPI00188AB823|nr:universal stress protein [Zobellia roscoffensis]
MSKKLLLPTDFSKNSLNAIQYAIRLYANTDCDFYILNTYAKNTSGLDSLTLLDPDDAFNKLSEKRSKEGLGNILTRLTFKKDNPKHRFHVLSRSTLFLDAVKDIIENMQIDMLIMGAKGIANTQTGSYGKTTISTIENIRKCPVLIVPKKATFGDSKEIVFATNFKTDFNLFDIQHIADIAKISNSSIQILGLKENDTLDAQQEKNKSILETYFKNIDLHFNMIHDTKMNIALQCFVQIKASAMISYVNKKQTFWESMGFGKCTLEKLGYFDDIPILAINDRLKYSENSTLFNTKDEIWDEVSPLYESQPESNAS